jgi:hypothetical protein
MFIKMAPHALPRCALQTTISLVSIRRTREHFAPLTLLGFYLLGVQQIEPLHYALFKGVWAGLMAAVLVVPMVLCALRPAPLAVSADSGNG